MIWNYLKAALRNLEHNKLQSIISILSLAIGFVCFILILIWVRDELSYNRFHEHRDELYQLTILHETGVLDPNVPYFLPFAMAEKFPEIVNYTRIYNLGNITNCQFRYQEDQREPVMFYEDKVIMVDTGFFSMFSFPFIYGNPQTALSGRDVVVLNKPVAEKYFGNENPIGKVITLNNQLSLTVAGVVDIPGNSNIRFDFVFPLRSDLSEDMNWRDPSYIMLNESTSHEIFREKITEALQDLSPAPLPWKLIVGIMPITKSHLSFDKLKYVYIFSIIALFILLIACINYIILSTSRSTQRAREISLRKVVGGNRIQLISQLLTESVIISFISLFLALIIVEIILPGFNTFIEKNLRIGYLDHPQILLVLCLIPFVTGILSGIYPALSFTGKSPVVALQAAVRFRTQRSPFRIASVVTQFTISMFLLVCTMLVMKQLKFFQKQPLGFNTDYIIQTPVNAELLTSLEAYRETLLQHSDIISVTAGQAVPFNEDYKTGLDWEGKDPDFEPIIRYSITLPNYLETFDMDITEGRAFSNDFTTDISNFVVNEKAVKYMNMENPLGKKLIFWGREGEIIGVVKDFHHVSLHREILPHVFTIHPANYRGLKHIFIRINPANIEETIDYIGTTTQKYAPDFPFDFSFIDEGIGKLYKEERKLGTLITWFSVISIFISCLGIFGLTVFMSEQRTKEIAIRKVNGAVFQHLLFLLNKDLIKWILLALVIASPLAYYSMHRWLQHFAYRAEISFVLFILAGLSVLLISMITASSVIMRAANLNPADTLKFE
jgi:putative ABC transport system permease protein